MGTASTVSGRMREASKGAPRMAGEAASQYSREIEKDLQALRDDFRRLAEQVAGLVASSGNALWQRARASVEDAVSDAPGKGREAASAVREASDRFIDALDESIKTRPFTMLALVAGLAFLLGATLRR
jgi:ElaB/YqjD/DUF883 family membrane-anchored ribosome-binding protein